MASRIVTDGLGLGFLVWALAFLLGMLFFSLVETKYLGLAILAAMIPITLWLLWWRFGKHPASVGLSWQIGVIWLALAVTLDYLLLVTAFGVENYYDADLIVYYGLSLFAPPAVAFYRKTRKRQPPT
jgi:hypothetical protein